MLKKYSKRFEELAERASKISKTKDINSNLLLEKLPNLKYDDIAIRDKETNEEKLNLKNIIGGWIKLVKEQTVDESLYHKWCLNVLNLLRQACGEDSYYYQKFSSLYEKDELCSFAHFQKLNVLFDAAKDDYTGGYIMPIETLVHAEVFDDLLEQAEELLKNGYYVAAGVCAGIVLETTLRNLCQQYNIDTQNKKLDTMNSELVKVNAYTKLEQKNITMLAHIRNCAAHGKTDELNKKDVEKLINEVKHFISTTFINN